MTTRRHADPLEDRVAPALTFFQATGTTAGEIAPVVNHSGASSAT